MMAACSSPSRSRYPVEAPTARSTASSKFALTRSASSIARNAALDWLRSRKKWSDVDRNTSGEEEGPSYWDRLPDDAPDAQALLGRTHLWKEVEAAIEQLREQVPPEQREVVLMRHQSELTFREIAELTGVSINTALGRMRYALINLRKILEPEWFQDSTADLPGAPRR